MTEVLKSIPKERLLYKYKKELTELECQNISCQEELRTTSETQKLKKIEIEELSVKVKDLVENISKKTKDLDIISSSIDRMSITLKNNKEKKIKLEESLQEKNRLLKEQSSYLIVLQEELAVLEEDLVNLTKESNSTKESNNNKKK